MSSMQAASLYTSIVLESTSFIVPIRDCTSEVEKSSRKMAQEQDRLAKSADRLLSSVDPVYAAQSKFNKEMDKAKSLFSAGAISAEQFAMAESNLKSRLEQSTTALTVHNTVSAQSQQRMRLLGYQISDVGTQLAGGQNPFLILAQQGPQIAMAFDGAQGAVGRFASFLVGPWGAALMAATSAVGMFASKLLESRNAAEEHEKSSRSLKDAMEELDRVTGRTNKTQETQIRLAAHAAREKYDDAIATRELTKAELERTKAAIDSMTGPAAIALGISPESTAQAMAQLERITKAIEDQDKKIAEDRQKLRGAETALAMLDVASSMDAAAAATRRYEQASEALRASYEADKSTMSLEEFKRREEALRRTRDAEIEAAKEAEKSGKAQDKAARDWEKASNSRIQALLSERAAMEQYVKDLKILEEASRSGAINAAERALATIRSRQEMLDGLGLEKIGPKIADFDADKAAKNGPPKFDQKDLYDIPSIRKGAQAIEEARKSADRYDMAITSISSNMISLGEEAAFAGKSLGSVFSGLLEDLGRVAFRLTVLEPLARSFANALKGGFGGSSSSIMPGEGNWFEKTLKGIGSIFSVFGGARANGGPVTAGKTYLVGERGPELFTASSSGNIIPNGALQGMGRAIEQHFHVNAQGAILAQGLIAEMQAVGIRAEVRGSADAQVQMTRRARRRLP